MAMGLKYYPPSLKETPRGLTAPSPAYWLFSLVTLASLCLFLLFYLALIAGAGFLVFLAITYPTRLSRGAVILKVGAIACSAALLVFLVKGLFKKRQEEPENLMEIGESEQPDLFAFVRRLCRELRAPFPHRIFLTDAVTAAVSFDTSLLNLVLPVRKNLVIGLGLVNVLTVNEFKAVLAHEFGHFSQSGMALGNYVHVANRVISDMVFGRDAFDEWLEDCKEMDLRIAVFAWVMSGVLWVLRLVLTGVFLAMNLVRFALMRQMEFHADLMAASITGSDALTHALYRFRVASEMMERALDDLRAAAARGLYSRDLYYHQTRALDALRWERRNPKLGVPPPLPEDPAGKTQVFPPLGDGGGLFSTHPSVHDRERNLKRSYVRRTDDGESPWVLFREPELLRASMTAQVYRKRLDLTGLTLAEPEQVHAALHGQQEASAFNPRYGGLYDGRFLMAGDIAALARDAAAQPWPPQRLAQVCDRLYGGKLGEWVEAHARRREDRQILATLDREPERLKAKEFDFRGVKRRPGEVKGLLRLVDGELEEDRRWLERLDGDVFRAHYQMAAQVGGQQELYARYEIHLRVQQLMGSLREQMMRVQVAAAVLSSGKAGEEDARKAGAAFQAARQALAGVLNEAARLPLPALPDFAAGMPLAHHLQPGGLVREHYGDGLPSPEWVGDLLRQMSGIHDRAGEVLTRSMGAILFLQERIAGAWRAAAGTAK